jgi:uncharacterized protein YsxB (DUF464 family)
VISIEVSLDREGVLYALRVCGHSHSGPRGSDIVCAAVSVLTRTFIQVVSSREGVSARFSAPERGFLEFSAHYGEAGKNFLYCSGVFLLEGLKSLRDEYPEYCSLDILQD